MRVPTQTPWNTPLEGITKLLALALSSLLSWGTIVAYFASLTSSNDDENLRAENKRLQKKLDDTNMRLELMKGTTGGGPQKYVVPLFDACFTYPCS